MRYASRLGSGAALMNEDDRLPIAQGVVPVLKIQNESAGPMMLGAEASSRQMALSAESFLLLEPGLCLSRISRELSLSRIRLFVYIRIIELHKLQRAGEWSKTELPIQTVRIFGD